MTVCTRIPSWLPPLCLPESKWTISVTIHGMRITSGKVLHGQIAYEGELPEGTEVTLLAHDNEETFEVGPELKAVLLESIAQCERGETISVDDLLREMRSRE